MNNEKYTTGKLFRRFIAELKPEFGQSEARQMVMFLFRHSLGIDLPKLLADEDQQISGSTYDRLKEKVNQLKKHVPIQYLIGETEFFGLRLFVDSNVLIPRSETEELLYFIQSDFKEKINPRKILDVGTGSGCIAISLKKIFPEAEILAIDNSKMALALAEKNANLNKTPVVFKTLDFLNDKEQDTLLSGFDLVVSNPPYVRESEKQMMKNNVLVYEPENALFVKDDDPLLYYDAIASFCGKHLMKGGFLYIEINEFLGERLVSQLEKMFASVMLKKDLNGKDRFIRALY